MFRSLVGVAALAVAGATATLPSHPLAAGLLLAAGAAVAAGAVRAAEAERQPDLATVPVNTPRSR